MARYHIVSMSLLYSPTSAADRSRFHNRAATIGSGHSRSLHTFVLQRSRTNFSAQRVTTEIVSMSPPLQSGLGFGMVARNRPQSQLLSRVEAHFHLGIHSRRVAALDRGLIAELRPRHRLAELRAAVQLRNLTFLADDDFAASRSAPGFPQGRGQDGGTLDQQSALFFRRNGDCRRFLLLAPRILLLLCVGKGHDLGHPQYGCRGCG